MKKNIIITGASSGLGKEIGKKFLKEKYNLINISRRMSKNRYLFLYEWKNT